MARITESEAKALWIDIKPIKSIQDKMVDIATTEVRGKLRRQSKYWAERTKVDEIDFDSKKEANRYNELRILEKAWKITNLRLQPKFLLQESFKYNWCTEKRVSYVSDFAYTQDNEKIVEDVKWFKTDIYKIKRKLFLYKYWKLYKFIET